MRTFFPLPIGAKLLISELGGSEIFESLNLLVNVDLDAAEFLLDNVRVRNRAVNGGDALGGSGKVVSLLLIVGIDDAGFVGETGNVIAQADRAGRRRR